jgi:hypothetical protein
MGVDFGDGGGGQDYVIGCDFSVQAGRVVAAAAVVVELTSVPIHALVVMPIPIMNFFLFR